MNTRCLRTQACSDRFGKSAWAAFRSKPLRRTACKLGPAALLGTAIVLCAITGCRALPERTGLASAPRSDGPITRVVVLWSEGLLRQDNVPVAQGFAGKMYLFGADTKPVTASGKFTIYAFDETVKDPSAPAPRHVKPDFSWELNEADLQELLKKDAIGWSYSLWLPCGPPAPVERRYTLMVSFTPDNGSRVLGESSLVTLPAVRELSIAQGPSHAPSENHRQSPVSLTNKLQVTP